MKEKAVIVTGAGKRVGREFCLELAKNGYSVIAHYNRSSKEIETLKEDVEKFGRQFFSLKSDLSKGESNIIERSLKFPVKICGLVNNASVFNKSALLKEKYSEVMKVFSVNAFAPLFLSREYAVNVKSGFIINIIDANISSYNKDFQIYRMSKKLLMDFTKETARLLGPRIRVNGIAPGSILPSKYSKVDKLREKIKKTPLNSGGSMKGILSAFGYLINNKDVTGQILYIDGGMHVV